MRTRRRLLVLMTIASAGLAVAGYDATVDREGRITPSGDGSTSTPTLTLLAEPPSGRPSLLELERLQAARAQQPAAELFAAKSWYIPPPAPPPQPKLVLAPVKPTAPPLPFVFMGRMMEAEKLTVFLVKGDRVYMVSEGDAIDDTYKVIKIEPGQVTLRYLPLDLAQTLAAGETP